MGTQALRTRATIRPYKPKASAKIKIRMYPTYSFGWRPTARTPASPTMPIARPEPNAARPQQRPAARCLKPWLGVYPSLGDFTERVAHREKIPGSGVRCVCVCEEDIESVRSTTKTQDAWCKAQDASADKTKRYQKKMKRERERETTTKLRVESQKHALNEERAEQMTSSYSGGTAAAAGVGQLRTPVFDLPLPRRITATIRP